VLVVLVALFLVNLPFVHQSLAQRQLARKGHDVAGTVLDARTVGGRHFVDYRLPASADPVRTRWSARVDAGTYERARRSRTLLVRVVPGEPASNRPLGEVGSPLFAVIAIGADAVLLLVAVVLWRRWRRWSVHEVVDVTEDGVRLAAGGRTLTVAAPERWAGRLRAGDRVSGTLHLAAEEDVVPGSVPTGLEQVHGASYVVGGRVVDARSGRVDLELEDGFRIRVQTGGHRILADLRDSTRVRGTLCFTPTAEVG
jgi:hypothetical protein